MTSSKFWYRLCLHKCIASTEVEKLNCCEVAELCWSPLEEYLCVSNVCSKNWWSKQATEVVRRAGQGMATPSGTTLCCETDLLLDLAWISLALCQTLQHGLICWHSLYIFSPTLSYVTKHRNHFYSSSSAYRHIGINILLVFFQYTVSYCLPPYFFFLLHIYTYM